MRQEVELEGVEPSSKQGNHTLSTRLFWTSFSCCNKTQTTNYSLSLKNFITRPRLSDDYFRFSCAAEPSDSEQHP